MKRTAYLPIILFLIISTAIISTAQEVAIIPKPANMTIHEGTFTIEPETPLFWNEEEAHEIAGFLNSFLSEHFSLQLKEKRTKKPKNGINIIIDPTYGEEAYNLLVDENEVILKGSASGIFYALQTFMQLLPVKNTGKLQIQQLEIDDKPRFAYRGAMLDVGRYFFSPQYVKRFIDIISYFKLNVLHWHLTEDAGWRVEIKKYPELTKIGAWRRGTQTTRAPESFDRLPHGGYYTQEQIRDIVAYAKKKHVTIVPEIDMPGHTLAALAAYPEFSCTGGPFHVLEYWGIQEDIMCAGNEKTFEFIEGVLDEIIDLFPSPVIHIGGDEAPKARWKVCPKCQARIQEENLRDEHELQSYFIKRVAAYVESKGRRIIGWDEIMEGGLAPNAMVMSWRGEKGGIEAARQHHDVVMSPTSFLYLDYYQGKPENEPFNIGGNLPLGKVYSYEPLSPQIPEENQKYVKGVQGNIWMEYIHSEPKLEYMAFPRIQALADIGWSTPEKDYSEFLSRLSYNLLWLEKMNVNFRIPDPVGLEDVKTTSGSVKVSLIPPVKGSKILYTLNGEDPLLSGVEYNSPLDIRLKKATPVVLKCIVKTAGGKVSGIKEAKYELINEQ